MKKILFLSLIFGTIISTSANAQPSQPARSGQPTVDQAAMLKQAKEQQVPAMVAKTGLTEAQANKIVEINIATRMEAASSLVGLSENDRAKKLAELKAEKEKRYSEIPLTTEQIKSVYAFYDDMGKSMEQRKSN